MRVLTVCIFFILFAVTACEFNSNETVWGNGTLASQQRGLSGFNEVQVVGGLDVVLVPGATHGVKVEADQNLLEYIETELHGSELVIAPRDGYNLREKAGLKIYVTAPQLSSLQIDGSGTVTSQGKISSAQKMNLDISGSGEIKLDLDAPEIETGISGSGTITLTGTTRSFASDINGSGEIYAFNLLSEATSVGISGSGSAEIFASKELAVTINGTGDVAFKGAPAISQNISGSGSVHKVN